MMFLGRRRMPNVFLCYRSGDDAYAAALLDEKLSQAFGLRAIFRASRSILPGESYSSAIMRALEECQTVLVIIGPTWVDRLRHDGTDDDDWVRTEIMTAMDRGSRVIPVLLNRVSRLDRHYLPSDIADLAEKQYLSFDHRHVARDVDQLVTTLRQGDSSLVVHPDGESPDRSETAYAYTQRRKSIAGRMRSVRAASRRSHNSRRVGRNSGRFF
jgi:hypothetical protein